ncbi:MAG: hypothetical protein HOG25_01995 [Gammaproteobacteria bacterium]|nr:hypothetical protein [Gammaproteobacteria bacterium]
MAEHYRTGPDKTVERPGIGRRSSECQIDCVNLLIKGDVQLIEAELKQDNLDMPRTDELISSVRDFLRAEVMSETAGRTNFMARVASNSLDIVLRELELGSQAKEQELERLRSLLGEHDGSLGLGDLRWQLTRKLRSGEQSLQDQQLQNHLRQTVTNQIAIDQPRYSGLKTALDT